VAHVSHESVGQIAAAGFFVVPTVTYRLLFVLVILQNSAGYLSCWFFDGLPHS
jgi:hypothetical protein